MEPKVQNQSPTFALYGDSAFTHLVQVPDDPILEDGKPLVFNVVREAEERLLNDRSRNKEYLPIVGTSEFDKLSAKLIFGADSLALQENRVTTVQTLSGTGALRIGGEFLAILAGQQSNIYLPQPTCVNHPQIFTHAGLSVKTYRYYASATRGIDFQGLSEDLGSAPSGSFVLLHACAHNPTGLDPSPEQWEQIRQLIRSKAHLPFFDSAYQGIGSGSLDADAESVRLFTADGGELLVAQSYAENMGLYGEAVGALSIVCKTVDIAIRVESQLNFLIRNMYSTPPIHGAAVVTTILKERDLYNKWTHELAAIVQHIKNMRQELSDDLLARGTPGEWSHIINETGIFAFVGLKSQQVAHKIKEYQIYMTSDGRINMAGVSSKTIPLLVDAIYAAVTQIA